MNTPLDQTISPLNGQHAWIIADQKIGHQVQAEALCRKLRLSHEHYILRNRPPWQRKLPLADLSPLTPPAHTPAVMISVGGMGLIGQKALRKRFPEVFRIHIMQQPQNNDLLDVHILMQHDLTPDYRAKPHEYLALMPPSPIKDRHETEMRLPVFDHRQKIGLLLGGANSVFRLNVADAERIGKTLSAALANIHAALYISPSRRTPKPALDVLCDSLSIPYYCWDQQSPNPHQQILHEAEILLVSQDSINMQSDVLHAHKPLYILPLKRKLISKKINKYQKFSDNLIRKNLAQYFEETITTATIPVNSETQRIATFINKRYQNFAISKDR